jgi:uncharacterized membrane protein
MRRAQRSSSPHREPAVHSDAPRAVGPSAATYRVVHTVEVEGSPERVFASWTRFEDLPLFMECVRRVKRIDERRVLWDVDIWGRQVVWEGLILEQVPGKGMRWESVWGAPNSGELHLEALPGERTRLVLEIRYEPRHLLERIGARLGAVDRCVRRELARFQQVMARTSRERSGTPESRSAAATVRRSERRPFRASG